jgi:hypothetical protein
MIIQPFQYLHTFTSGLISTTPAQDSAFRAILPLYGNSCHLVDFIYIYQTRRGVSRVFPIFVFFNSRSPNRLMSNEGFSTAIRRSARKNSVGNRKCLDGASEKQEPPSFVRRAVLVF